MVTTVEESTPLSDWLTGSAAARILGVSHKTVKGWSDQGKLTYLDTPLGRLYDPQSVEKVRSDRAVS